MKVLVLLLVLLFLPKERTFVFIGKFESAGVWEGSQEYTFLDKNNNTKYFVCDNCYDQQIPYNFLDENGNTNQELKGQKFRIVYRNFYEQRGESDEKMWVSKIVSIKRIE